MVAILAPAIEAGMSRKNNMKAYEEAGLYPFTRKPLMAPHIIATKGHTARKKTLNYDVIDYDKPVKAQVAYQLGPGGRMTTGKICDFPLTHENNIKLFEALDAEKELNMLGKAATKRVKAGKSVAGDLELAAKLEELKCGELVVKVKAAREREAAGTLTKGDEKLLKTRAAKKLEGVQDGVEDQAEEQAPAKKRRKKTVAESDDDSDSADEEPDDDGKDLLRKKWFDEELDAECTVTRRTNHDGTRALWYTYDDAEGEQQKEKSSVAEVREWIEGGE
jgi:hypothetical protein